MAKDNKLSIKSYVFYKDYLEIFSVFAIVY